MAESVTVTEGVKKHDVVIANSPGDNTFAQELSGFLKSEHFSVYHLEGDIKYGENKMEKCLTEMHNSSKILLVVTKESVLNAWCTFQMVVAMENFQKSEVMSVVLVLKDISDDEILNNGLLHIAPKVHVDTGEEYKEKLLEYLRVFDRMVQESEFGKKPKFPIRLYELVPKSCNTSYLKAAATNLPRVEFVGFTATHEYWTAGNIRIVKFPVYELSDPDGQEVKRRLFEEKVQRENWRKQEREKERKERDSEIQRLKEQHSRELKLLKAKYEREEESNASKSVNPTRANPYASIHIPDAESLEELPRRKSTSSSSVSSSMIFISDNITLGASIPSYRLHGYGSDAHYEYEVKICVSDECWTIFRRYSKFRQMHQEHKRRYPEINALVFPPKKLFSRSEKVVMERRRQLELYLRNLLAIFVNSPLCPLHPSQNKYLSKKVLCDFEPFFRKGLFEVTKHGTT